MFPASSGCREGEEGGGGWDIRIDGQVVTQGCARAKGILAASQDNGSAVLAGGLRPWDTEAGRTRTIPKGGEGDIGRPQYMVLGGE